MSPRRNGNGPPTPRIIIVPASPPTTSSPTTADSDEEERFSPMSISPTSPRTTLIAPPRRFRRLLPAPERPCPPLQPQSQQSQSQPQPQPQQSPQSPQSPQPLQPQQPLQQQPHPEPRTTHPLSPAFPPSRPFQIHTFIPSPPPSPPSSPSSPSSPPPPPPRESPPPYSPTTEPPLKRLKRLPLPHSIANLIPPHHNPFSNPKPLPLPPQTTPSLQSKSKLAPLLAHLRTKLHPLVSSTTGQSHPSFPQTLLAFHCLTHAQLDSLARHFHQVYPAVPATEYYPITVPPWVGTEGAAEVDLEVKRRRFGRFIGLRGCESPTLESSGQEGRNAWVEMAERRRRVGGWLERLEIEGFGSGGRRGSGDREGEGVMEEKEVEEMYLDNGAGVGDGEMPSEERETPEEMLARMAREWDAAMERAKWDSNFALRWKMGG